MNRINRLSTNINRDTPALSERRVKNWDKVLPQDSEPPPAKPPKPSKALIAALKESDSTIIKKHKDESEDSFRRRIRGLVYRHNNTQDYHVNYRITYDGSEVAEAIIQKMK